eukprot:gene26748-33374_t
MQSSFRSSGTAQVTGASGGVIASTQSSPSIAEYQDDVIPPYVAIFSESSAAVSSANPTLYPTFGVPSKSPVMAGSTAFPTVRNAIKFSATQIVSGISIDSYGTNTTLNENTLKAAIAATMQGVSVGNIIDFTAVQ